ncbi:DUF397 domain-containing protein [Spongiactinospora gelatinilytica]|uniref:DUF397 domain-containing protein n=1 Tax=Spongiactinospora gelatinilytica TaxID=2666298 RepID=A0A2W2G4X2_9ACTN|nr:DUF397 domain-containing protein [Spongiactinospora gelatinilytica]PZG43083.1 DUF397 domain-containing protein [Spongiactinospora gelatinilytica]
MAAVGANLTSAGWRKSSYSGGSGGNCVEVATDLGGLVGVRDSKDPTGPALCFSSGAWRVFLNRVKGGDFD